MTDKKMIEEMAREIHFNYWGTCAKDSCSDCPHNFKNICKDKEIAEKLYNKLFPEGSVVLSKDEYKKDFCSQFNKGCEIARKETAADIIKEVTRTRLYDKPKDEEGCKLIGYLLTPQDAEKLAAHYEVEIDE